ncbi:MAG TPA: type II toxin-antitoxin system RelE/ParE family toxin [Pirellulales bacterium]
MMRSLRRTPEAERDIEQIVRYLAQDNLPAALAWLDKLELVFSLFLTQPEIGQRRWSPRYGDLRRHAHGNYIVYYKLTPDILQIVRVLHGARDQGRLV